MLYYLKPILIRIREFLQLDLIISFGNKNKIMKLIFTLTLILIFTNSQSQNCHKVKEIVTNRHEPVGHTKNHPYTFFDRHRETFQKTINEVRKRIFNDKPNGDIYKAYVTIYNKANENRPSDGGLYNLKTNGDPGAPSSL